jgi:hypothetical protein
MVKKCPSAIFNRFLNFYIFANIEAKLTECVAKLCKMRPVLKFLVSNFQQVYVPEKQISTYEGMIAWKDWFIFKVYVSDKPDRYGIKSYLVSESKSCYICNMEVYTGNT